MLIQYCGHYMSSSQCLLDRTSYSTVVTVCPARSACSTGPHTAMWSLHVQLVVPVRQDFIQQCGHCMSSSQCLLDRTSYSTVVTVCPARSACQSYSTVVTVCPARSTCYTGPHTALWSLYVQLVVPVIQDLIQHCGHCMSSSQCLFDRTSYSTVVTVCPARSACQTGPHTALWSLYVQLVVPVRQDLIQHCGHCMSSSQCLLDRTSYSTVVTVCAARSACQTGPHTAQIAMLTLT